MKNGRDGGFNYWKLNYKKKFIRTLWMVPVTIFLTIQMFMSGGSSQPTLILVTALFVTLIVQLLYTYVKWKNEI
ncbi:MAG: hypothetical protein R3267_05055 [Paenisporosarcina sp.]|nr:hypothetical protein [Paenisporosarcina sp.]